MQIPHGGTLSSPRSPLRGLHADSNPCAFAAHSHPDAVLRTHATTDMEPDMDTDACPHTAAWYRHADSVHFVCTECGATLTVAKPQYAARQRLHPDVRLPPDPVAAAGEPELPVRKLATGPDHPGEHAGRDGKREP